MGKFDTIKTLQEPSAAATPPSSTAHEPGTEQLVPLRNIHPTFTFTLDGKPLRHYYDEAAIQEWADHDLKPNGIRSPLWVRPMPEKVLKGKPRKEPQYELVAGMRRFKGATYLKMETVPVKVFNWDEDEAYNAAVAENFNRRDFTPLEELDSILSILEIALDRPQDEVIQLLYRMKNDFAGNTKQDVLLSPEAQTVEQVFRTLNRMTWQSFINTRLSLRNKPTDILDAIREGKLDYSTAMPIASIEDPKVRQRMLEAAIEQNLSVRDVRDRVATLKEQVNVNPEPSLPQRFTALGKQLRRSKAWEDPKKKSKIEKLLSQLEELL